MAYNIIRYFALIGTIISALSTQSFAAQSHGEMKGHAIEHNAETIKALVANCQCGTRLIRIARSNHLYLAGR